MKFRIFPLFIIFVAAMAVLAITMAHAETPTINLPYGIGSVQLPFQNPEVLWDEMRPIKGGLLTQTPGVAFDILTIGKLSNGYRILDGLLGGVMAIPNSGAQPDAFGGLGHDIVQDLPFLASYASVLHGNFGVSYSNAAGGWLWGGGVSYVLGPAQSTTPSSASAKPAVPLASRLNLYNDQI